jgi:hypothetical protein
MTIPLRLSVAALLVASAALVPAIANRADATTTFADPCIIWRPCRGGTRAPDVTVTSHIVCWRMGGFCWVPVNI